LSSADLAVERVAERVASGGHNVPADTVQRRYRAGIRNFFNLYQPIATSWTLYNASGPEPVLVAESLESGPFKVYDRGVWATVQRQANESRPKSKRT
jgi:predicted ABC-type ATPase